MVPAAQVSFALNARYCEKRVPIALQVEGAQAVPGYLFGLAQPSLRVRLRCTQSRDEDALAKRLLGALSFKLPEAAGVGLVSLAPQGEVPSDLLIALAAVVHRLQAAAGLTVLPKSRLVDAANGRVTLALPGPVPTAVGEALAWAMHALDSLVSDPLATELPEALWTAQAALHQRLAGLAPAGANNRHLLRVAYTLGIPILALPGSVFQFGWGRHSRLFKSTISDATGSIGTTWAKNKHQTNALLRMAGLPVPEQEVVGNLEASVAAAKRIGYPVVLKPANLEQGTGVEAGLNNENELRLAHTRSSQHAKTLLLEKHLLGDDYRVNVVQGEVLGAVHRRPARVVGDGVSSVTDLVAAVNRDRQVVGGPPSLFKPIELDAEALELMSREGFIVQSVLPAGKVLTLRRTANLARGGTVVDATLLIHPDNAALCVQAAALLRLDIAGLDLLIPDISRSWHEVGGAFCEVNAQPQTGGANPWMFEKILKRFVVGRGRVPTLLVLSSGDESLVACEIVATLSQTGLRAAQVHGTGKALLAGCRAQLMAPDLGALVVITNGTDLPRWGLPVDCFDVLVLDGWGVSEVAKQSTLRLLESHVVLAVVAGTAPEVDELQQVWGEGRLQLVDQASMLPQAILKTLLELPDGD